MINLGYEKPLFILPFDHRLSFIKTILGVEWGQPDAKEIKRAIELKKIIYKGFKLATKKIPRDVAAILVDEQFGGEILQDAIASGHITCLATEKSGLKEFEFEYGNKFAEHINKYQPVIVKALVRYNPEDNKNLNIRQAKKLKKLADFCHRNNYKFMIETLVPATDKQLKSVKKNLKKYDKEIRPGLMIRAISELQAAGVEPDIWKVEGLPDKKNFEAVVKQARIDDRREVGVIILGRGLDKKEVEKWLKIGRKVKGIIGFAIGRTVWQKPLLDYRKGKINQLKTVERISKNYYYFYKIFKI